ncbi:MAG: hypothetical protein GY811_01810 [Myxococcales bacterium]|nr:hypothetical protein [Myxococcales bacterium]
MRSSFLFAAALSSVVFAGCASDGDDAISSLIAASAEAAGENCDDGGLKVESGADLNGDGALDFGINTERAAGGAGADGVVYIEY